MLQKFKAWLVKQLVTPENMVPVAHSTAATSLVDEEDVQHLVPYDENLLERSRTQWQFGDWESLTLLERDTLQHHPDRAKLALLAASGHLQQGDSQAARQFTRLAQDWGCSKKLISQILISGVHNSIGRATGAAGQLVKAQKHFNQAITTGAIGGEIRLLTQARMGEQILQLQQRSFKSATNPNQSTTASEDRSASGKRSIESNIVLEQSSNCNYCISINYKSRSEYHHYDDMLKKDDWQLEVYLQTYAIMRKNGLRSIADIGCGSAFKLMTYLGEFETIGYELAENVEILKKLYPNRVWKVSHLDDLESIETDLIICSDVIEHLVDPDVLINCLKKQSAKFIVLSTPDRSLVYEADDPYQFGPPRNKAHQREWTFTEFASYISRDFTIVEHKITNQKQATQMIVCKPK